MNTENTYKNYFLLSPEHEAFLAGDLSDFDVEFEVVSEVQNPD